MDVRAPHRLTGAAGLPALLALTLRYPRLLFISFACTWTLSFRVHQAASPLPHSTLSFFQILQVLVANTHICKHTQLTATHIDSIPSHVKVYQQHIHPPHFKVVYGKGEIWETFQVRMFCSQPTLCLYTLVQGRNNLFHALVLLVYCVQNRLDHLMHTRCDCA